MLLFPLFLYVFLLATPSFVAAQTKSTPATLPASATADFFQCSLNKNDIAKGFGISLEHRKWPNAIVPYYYDFNDPEFASTYTPIVKAAARFYNENTNLCLVPTDELEGALKLVKSNDQNTASATVGYSEGFGGTIWVNFGYSAMLHEIGHAIGLLHEQSRADRDEYVTINWENVDSRYAHNFQISNNNADSYTPYDYESIMHYSPFSFSINRQPTISLAPGRPLTIIGPTGQLTTYDILQINTMYPDGLSVEACEQLFQERAINIEINSVEEENLCAGRETVFEVSVLDEFQQDNLYRWSTPFGEPAVYSGPNYPVKFTVPGLHTVTLRVQKNEFVEYYSLEVRIPVVRNEMEIFGNPVQDRSAFHFRVASNNPNYAITLINALGQIMYQNTLSDPVCKQDIQLDLSRLKAGFYWLVYQNEGKRIAKKILLQ